MIQVEVCTQRVHLGKVRIQFERSIDRCARLTRITLRPRIVENSEGCLRQTHSGRRERGIDPQRLPVVVEGVLLSLYVQAIPRRTPTEKQVIGFWVENSGARRKICCADLHLNCAHKSGRNVS